MLYCAYFLTRIVAKGLRRTKPLNPSTILCKVSCAFFYFFFIFDSILFLAAKAVYSCAVAFRTIECTHHLPYQAATGPQPSTRDWLIVVGGLNSVQLWSRAHAKGHVSPDVLPSAPLLLQTTDQQPLQSPLKHGLEPRRHL